MNYVLPRPYAVFKPTVEAIRAGASDAQLVGAGTESTVWRVALEGASYAVKLAKPYSPRGRRRDAYRATENKIRVGMRGLGIAGLEQLQSGSPEDGAVICDYATGIPLSQLSRSMIRQISPVHVAALRDTVAAATRAGIEFDGWNADGGNVLFCPRSGFTLLDYWENEHISLAANNRNLMSALGTNVRETVAWDLS